MKIKKSISSLLCIHNWTHWTLPDSHPLFSGYLNNSKLVHCRTCSKCKNTHIKRFSRGGIDVSQKDMIFYRWDLLHTKPKVNTKQVNITNKGQ